MIDLEKLEKELHHLHWGDSPSAGVVNPMVTTLTDVEVGAIMKLVKPYIEQAFIAGSDVSGKGSNATL